MSAGERSTRSPVFLLDLYETQPGVDRWRPVGQRARARCRLTLAEHDG